MKRVLINGRWPLNLPDHRADRPEWPYWEATRLAAMHHAIQPGDVVYDIGAEAGDFPALFATWGAQVVMIEPNPKVWPTIRAVWEGNDLAPLGTFEGMVSDTANCSPANWICEGYIPTVAYREPFTEAHGFHHIGEHDDPTTTLDELVYYFSWPDVVTMDVEGGEGHVIRGAKRTLTEIKPMVFMSIHPQFMADLYGESPDEIHETMKGYGYHGRFLGEDHEMHFVFAHPDVRPFPGAAEDYYIPGDRIVL
jgi:FkbM family methyltransferase